MRNFLKMGQVLLSALVIIGVSLSCAAIGEAGDSDAAIAGTGIEAEKNTNNRAEDYDRSRPLVTDPLLDYTSISGSKNDCAMSLAVNSAGNVYVAGYTHSADFPATAEAYDMSYNGGSYAVGGDVFVSKLDSNLNTLASTFIGGKWGERIAALAIDSAGNVYVAGTTSSDDFPTTAEAYDMSYNGGREILGGDVFVAKFDPDLSTLLASTLIGGSDSDSASSLAIDSAGNVYVAGTTSSRDYPATDEAYDTSLDDEEYERDAFVTKLDPDLNTLLASTFIGGSSEDLAASLAIDSTGHVYLTGYTHSGDFPTTTGAYDTSESGGMDAFVAKLDADLSTLLASTFIGGSSADNIGSLAIDGAGNVYVMGHTHSDDFPATAGAYDTSFNGDYYNSDAFIAKLDADLSTLLAATFISAASSFATDSAANVYVAGMTSSDDFPHNDAFVSKLDPGLNALLASTGIGGSNEGSGSGENHAHSIAMDSAGNVYIAGSAYYLGHGVISEDVFVSKFAGGL